MLRPLLIITTALGSVGEVGDQVSTAVRNEFALREAAHFPERTAGLLEGADWRERFAALEAVARRAPGAITEPQRELARAGLEDEHPNVRASALLVHARHVLVLPQQAHGLAADPLPSVRLNLARAAAHLPGEAGDTLLVGLTEDEDPDVAREARTQLLGRGEASAPAQALLFELDPTRMDADAFLDALDVLERCPINEDLLRLVGDLWRADEELGTTAPDVQTHLARRALWEALTLIKLDEREDLGETLSALRPGPASWTGDEAAALRRRYRNTYAFLARHWFVPLGEAGAAQERRRLGRLLGAVESAWDSSLADVFLQAADEWTANGNVLGAGARPEELRSVAFEALFGSRCGAQAERRPRPDDSWSTRSICEYFERASAHATGWGEWVGRYLHSQDSLVRDAALSAVVDTWKRTGDSVSASLLIDMLRRPDSARDTYRSLVGARRELPGETELFAWWSSRPLEDRLSLLREHARGRAYPFWREALIDLWASERARVVSVPELLAAFEGDRELRELLRRWTLAEVRVLEAGEVPGEETTRGPWREAEARALWLVQAWAEVAGEGRTGQELELLLRVGRLGKELGKFLVADLVKTAEGRRATREVLERPELSRRIRLEVLLVNTDLTTPDELMELFVAYDTCDVDLKTRILERAAGLDDELVRTRLVQVALDSEASSAEHQQAVESLSSAGPAELTVPHLQGVLAGSGDYETKRATVAALGQVAREWRSLGLLELYRDPTQRELLGDELLPALVRIELRGTGALGEDLAALWRARADEAAVAELEQRFRGARLAARGFEYRGWLAAAEALAEVGALEEALGERWWAWDGRLLMHLSQLVRGARAEGSRELARLLDRGALVALLGEGEAPDRAGLVVRCRARLLHGALDGENWAEANGWVRVLLDDWRSGRTTSNAMQSVLGSHDRETGNDPLHRLLTLEATTSAWQALQDGRLKEARAFAEEARCLPRDSVAAHGYLTELERAIEERQR